MTRQESGADHEDAEMSADAADGPPGPASGPVGPSRGVNQSGDEPPEAHGQRSRHRGVKKLRQRLEVLKDDGDDESLGAPRGTREGDVAVEVVTADAKMQVATSGDCGNLEFYF